jgi:mannan endo-1,4-beta-mannosidase
MGVRGEGAPNTYQGIETFARAVAQQPSIVLYFSGWGSRFRARFAGEALAHGAMPLVQINPAGISMDAVAAGSSDQYLRSFAREVRAFGHPVIIGFAHEMNGSWYPWGYRHTSPSTWVAAWRHVVSVFRQQGALNVIWLWTVSSGSTDTSLLHRYWPGARYVNWVGVDGYYYTTAKGFTEIFAPAITAIRRFSHAPILLSEVGIGPVAGQTREIPDLFAGIRSYHLLGLVWYDVAQHAGLYHQDWRLEGNPAAVEAFRRGVAAMMASRR